MQRLRRVNVMYSYTITQVVLPNIVTVHKKVEIEMADGSRPPHKFTDLCQEFMWLDSPTADSTVHPLFDAIIPITSGPREGSARVTHRADNKEAAMLVRKIRHSVAAWFFGYWTSVWRYKLRMVRKLMESFDMDSALLARYSVFDILTLAVETEYGETDKQLENMEAVLGIDQGRANEMEYNNVVRVDVVGHREALAMTLRDQVEDINDADCSGPTRNSDFSQSTGNSTNNFDAMIRQHTKRDKVLKNIELVDRNYALENNLVESERRTTVLIEQNWLLQDHLAAGNQVERAAGAASEDRMEDDEEPEAMRSGGMCSLEFLGMEEQEAVSCRGISDATLQQEVSHRVELAHHAKSGFSSTTHQCTKPPLQESDFGPAGSGEEPD